jgi:hypothetical protein
LVTPEQAELVALACQLGTVQLVMRNATDDVAENTGGADLQKLLLGRSDLNMTGDGAEDFFASLKPKEPAPPPPPVVQPKPQPEPEDDVFTMVIIDGNKPREVEFRRGKLITPPAESSPPPEVQLPAVGDRLPEAEGDGSLPTGEQAQNQSFGRRMH